MRLLKALAVIVFVFAPIFIWGCIVLAAKMLEAGIPGCSISGAGALGCGQIGHLLYDTLMVFAFFGLIVQLIWLIPAAVIAAAVIAGRYLRR